MSVYDNVIFHKEFELESYYLNTSTTFNGRYRRWQTKDLSPSLDTYAILPENYTNKGLNRDNNTKQMLYRRVPPEIKWTRVNEGRIINDDEDIIEDADHWRVIKHTGTIEISHMSRDGKRNSFELKFNNGVLNSHNIKETTEPIDAIFPEPPYQKALDLNKDTPYIKSTDFSISDVAEIVYQNNNIEKLEESDVSTEHIVLALNYYNMEYKS